jgi:hypothetical protein
MAKKPRDYAAEYKNYQGTPEQLKKQSERHKARRAYVKANGPVPASMDIDHVKPLSKGGTSKLSNLRAVPKSKNRSFARTSTNKVK